MLDNNSVNISSNSSTNVSPKLEECFLLRQILPITICFVGLVGNTFTFTIFSKTQYAEISTCYYMKILAFYDQLVMIMLLVRFLIKLPGSPIVHGDIFCKFYFGALGMFLGCTGWILLFTALDRYILIRFPLTARATCTIKRARICILTTTVFLFLIQTQNFWRVANLKGATVGTQCPYDLPISFTAPAEIVRVIILNGIPSVVVLLLALAISFQLSRSDRSRSTMNAVSTSTTNRLSRKVTRMSVAISWMYVVLTFPYYTNLVIRMADRSKSSNVSPVAYDMFVFAMYANSAVNWLMYLIVTQKFREDFVGLFKRTKSGSCSIETPETH